LTNDLITKYQYPKISVHIFPHKIIEGGIEEFITVTKGDILVMFTHNPTFFEKLLGKSATREMTFQTKIPILTFKKLLKLENKRNKVDYAID